MKTNIRNVFQNIIEFIRVYSWFCRYSLCLWVILFILVSSMYAITFSGTYLETEYLQHYGNRTNLPATYELYQIVKIAIEGEPNRYLKLRSALKTPWSPLNQNYNINLVNWFIQVQYSPYYFIHFNVGDVVVNYSSYTIHTEEWQDNLFSGLSLELNYSSIYIHSFVGFHSESTNRVLLQGEKYKTDLGFLYQYYDQNKIHKEEPSIWGGFLFQYQWLDKLIAKLIYIHENYRSEKADYGYYFFSNNVYEVQSDFSYWPWLHMSALYAILGQNYDAFLGAWDYFGQGQHRLILDYSQLKYFPAYEVGLTVKNPLYQKHVLLGTELGITYRYIDKNYNPIHMDNGTWEENRGEDFLDNIYSDTKGLIYRIVQPLYPLWDIGTEYRDFKNNDETIKNWDTRIFAQFKKLFNIMDIQLLYRIQKISGDVFINNVSELNSLYLKWELNFGEHWKAGVIYTENKNEVKGYNEFLVKVKYWF